MGRKDWSENGLVNKQKLENMAVFLGVSFCLQSLFIILVYTLYS